MKAVKGGISANISQVSEYIYLIFFSFLNGRFCALVHQGLSPVGN